MKKIILFLALIYSSSLLFAQSRVVKVLDLQTQQPITGASISIQNKTIAQTSIEGIANIIISADSVFTVSFVGYAQKQVVVSLNGTDTINVALEKETEDMEEITIISSTRSNQNIEYAPIKIEVLGTEEMNEESTVKPASVLGIIGDISGVQIQQTSATSGNANVRIQGLDGRYTQILRDGLPLYDGFSGGFGLTSIPPLDLKQVELIKGSSSTLYGAGAIGGLVNLISKKPTSSQEAILTLNQTTLKESNLNSFLSKQYKKLGYTLYAGITNQSAVDVNKDGFSDLARLKSFVIHPRIFINPNEKTKIIAGYTRTNESRLGGDMFVVQNYTDSIHQYFEKNTITRNSGELIFERSLNNKNKFVFKSSLSGFNRNIASNIHQMKARQVDYFSEASVLIVDKKDTWVTGLNFSGNEFRKLSGDSIFIKNIANNTIGAFVQYSHKWNTKSSVEIGLRDDYQFRYGNFILPRIALFQQLNKHFGVRAGFGVGYKIPDALTPQINDNPIQNILPIDANVKVEKSYGYNAEVNYKANFGDDNSIFINHAFFLTQLDRPLVANVQPTTGLIQFSSATKPIITKGFDTYIKLHVVGVDLYAGYTYTLAERKYLTQNQFIPLTPQFRMAYMLTKEWEGKGRFCIESSYTGSQYRLDNTKTPAYFFLASMIEYKFTKHCALIINGENLLDFRQSRKEGLFTGTLTNPSFNALWAPIDGRVVNACLRLSL